jgi:large subunit ribosomal protein L17
MRHGVAGRKFDRPTAHRVAMFRNLVTDLLRHEQIKTTEAKAKEVRGMAEKMITLGKDGTLAARRQALAFIYDKDVVRKVFDDLAPRYQGRTGGYTRIIRMGPRLGDGAPIVSLELVEE